MFFAAQDGDVATAKRPLSPIFMLELTRTPAKGRNCTFGGAAFSPDQAWPPTCATCGNTSYLNPLPVAVVLMPVDTGFLAIRRKIEPKIGTLNLPGGYINLGETWQEACVRELHEETGIVEQSENIELLPVKSAPDGTLLVFGHAISFC